MATLELKPTWCYAVLLGVALVLPAPSFAGDVAVQLDAGTGFSIKNSSGATERLRVHEATGNVSLNGALFVHTTGANSTFVGVNAGNPTTIGEDNTAFGASALRLNTEGVGNSAFGFNALELNTTGSANAAVGMRALWLNTTGYNNSAVGFGALGSNTTGVYNTGLGDRALGRNTTGGYNTAVGMMALYDNTSGTLNTAVGLNSLRSNLTGSRNVALGPHSGISQTSGSDNVYISNPGVAGESGAIRVGSSVHTKLFLPTTIQPVTGVAVVVDGSGQVGATTSSARFKEAIRDMGDTSAVIGKLRPVTFRYREGVVGGDADQVMQYGLIAEEVAAVAPELVAYDNEKRPYSVLYHEFPALLLNELQKQQRTIANLEARIAEMERRPQDGPRE